MTAALPAERDARVPLAWATLPVLQLSFNYWRIEVCSRKVVDTRVTRREIVFSVTAVYSRPPNALDELAMQDVQDREFMNRD